MIRLRADGHAPDPTVVRHVRPRMGTFVGVTLQGHDREHLESVAEALFAEVTRLEGILSEWNAASPVCAVNANAGRCPNKVPIELLDVLRTALEVSALTAGAYDPSWAPLAEIWRFDGSGGNIPSEAAIAAKKSLVDYRDIVIDEDCQTVLLRKPGMRVGFGAVAKAYIAEKAAALATTQSVSNVLVDAGGDVIARGKCGERYWTAGVRHPVQRELMLTQVELQDGECIVTSGDSESFFVANGQRFHHILNPRTGYPARGIRSVTVLAARAAFSDALSTGVFVMGLRQGLQLLEELNIAALLIDEGGAAHLTKAGAPRFRGIRMPVNLLGPE